MPRPLLALIFLFTIPATAQDVGPLYEILEQFRAAAPATPEEALPWAETILRALDENPNEEWTTRVRAYEEAGSIYWRNNNYEEAAPVFLGLWDEAGVRNDTDLAVTSIDHLINIYREAGAPPADVLALYDATEDWLQSPDPGQEDEFARLLKELYYERADLLTQYAQDEHLSPAERDAHAQEAIYFSRLAAGTAETTHTPATTLESLLQKWSRTPMAKAQPTEPAPDVQQDTPPPAPPLPKEESAPIKPEPAQTPTPSTPNTPPPPAPAPPAATGGDWVIPISIAIILLGWGIAAFIYLKRRS